MSVEAELTTVAVAVVFGLVTIGALIFLVLQAVAWGLVDLVKRAVRRRVITTK